jgi:hypothetical protein
MDKKETSTTERRSFIATMAGISLGILFASPNRLHAAKASIKDLVCSLEAEILEKSKPTRHPSIAWNTSRPVAAMNGAGKTIWEACNGRNTPRVISGIIHEKYFVSYSQAHDDCLDFLTRLKAAEVIQL